MIEIHLRAARADDVPAIVALLADDVLGAAREDVGDLAPYREAFAEIDADSSEVLLVACRGDEVVGTLQVSLQRTLARGGARRATIEAVRVAASARGMGLGEKMIRHAIAVTRDHGCTIVQLTSDKSRVEAHRFYERLGFARSHDGFKLFLGPSS